MTNTFNKPAETSGFFKPREHLGHLILITTVHERRKRFDDLKNAETDEVIADLVDLDGDRVLMEAVVLSHPGIVNRTRGLDSNILGRIGTVPSSKGNPAFVLEDYDEARGDVAKASAWVEEHNAAQFTRPTASPATPAPTPVQPEIPHAPGPQAAAVNPAEQAKQLFAAGLDDATVAQATGLPMAAVAALRHAA